MDVHVQVASDMRRWAETMNELKNTKSKKSAFDSKRDNSSATADAGFAILSKKVSPSSHCVSASTECPPKNYNQICNLT